MGFPDRIERTVHVERPVEQVWAAISTAEGLAGWFGQTVEIDLRVGGTATMQWDGGHSARMRIERVEPPHVLGYTWGIYGLPEDDARRTYVEFTLAADGAGTSVTVVETGFAQLSPAEHDTAYHGNTDGWGSELAELVAYLHA